MPNWCANALEIRGFSEHVEAARSWFEKEKVRCAEDTWSCDGDWLFDLQIGETIRDETADDHVRQHLAIILQCTNRNGFAIYPAFLSNLLPFFGCDLVRISFLSKLRPPWRHGLQYIAAGVSVEVRVDFMSASDPPVHLVKGLRGEVVSLDHDGIVVRFDGLSNPQRICNETMFKIRAPLGSYRWTKAGIDFFRRYKEFAWFGNPAVGDAVTESHIRLISLRKESSKGMLMKSLFKPQQDFLEIFPESHPRVEVRHRFGEELASFCGQRTLVRGIEIDEKSGCRGVEDDEITDHCPDCKDIYCKGCFVVVVSESEDTNDEDSVEQFDNTKEIGESWLDQETNAWYVRADFNLIVRYTGPFADLLVKSG